jgi:hypothetical protein
MTPLYSRLGTAVKSVIQLGPVPVAQAAGYRLGLWSGYGRWKTPAPKPESLPDELSLHSPFKLPAAQELQSVKDWQEDDLLAEAGEICIGKIRMFGGPAVPFSLVPAGPLSHWTAYELGKSAGQEDIKLVWEPARFGWAMTLARAYALTGNKVYADVFWQRAEEFILGNPPYEGPHWSSGQEVAIRIMLGSIASQVFVDAPSATSERKTLLAKSLAAHAARIPPTLIYARSQNNNHLLTEAAGLYTAGIALADLPQAQEWEKTGWTIFNQAIQRQIARNGTYVQHSINYHRLLLQVALWMQALASANGKPLPRLSLNRLAVATQWLLDQIDLLSGKAPNLGHNDGAYLFPLGPGGFSDFRPVAQAASRAFLGKPAFPPGPWDEMSLWFRLNIDDNPGEEGKGVLSTAAGKSNERKPIAIIRAQDSWASLRAVKYKSRPGQADQLHVDLWWKGQNLALDAGTFSYNAAAPWENAMADTNVHNTVQVDGRDQMTRAGRFLWLDWAQAFFLTSVSSQQKITGVHTGYRKLGARHQRSLAYEGSNHWQVLDMLLPVNPSPQHHSAVLNWLLPDLPWELHGTTLRLKTDEGILSLRVALANQTTAQTYVQLVRAGNVVAGPGTASPVLGWFSPTYNLKIPALSFRFFIEGVLPLSFSTDWFLP